MSLPLCFVTPEDYFEECLRFFHAYQHLYNFANTEILTKNVLDNIKVANFDSIDLDENVLEAIDDEYLNTFIHKLKRLQVSYDDFEEDAELERIFDAPLSPKKKHEILYLAKEIRELCEHVKSDVVVDFGCGLGYLDQLLFETTSLKVLGLECNESHYVGAKKRQRKYHPDSMQNIKYIKHTITEKSNTNIQDFIQDKFENCNGFCITGLHACADLTIDAINLFFKMVDAAALILMPCCYHKMNTNGHKFVNFPLSRCLRDIFDGFKGYEFLKVPFLRLGAQPPDGSCKLEDSIFNLLSRAVLEQYAQKENCTLRRRKRKAVKLKSTVNNFENYIHDASTNGFSLINTEDSHSVEFNLEKLRSLWRQIDHLTKKKAGIFIQLQNCLQPVIENFILFDRLVYLRENGAHCKTKKILNSSLSPRCIALIANK